MGMINFDDLIIHLRNESRGLEIEDSVMLKLIDGIKMKFINNLEYETYYNRLDCGCPDDDEFGCQGAHIA